MIVLVLVLVLVLRLQAEHPWSLQPARGQGQDQGPRPEGWAPSSTCTARTEHTGTGTYQPSHRHGRRCRIRMQTKKSDAISLLLSVLCTQSKHVCAIQDTHANTTWPAGSGFPPLDGLHGGQNGNQSSAGFGLRRPLINCHGILSLAEGMHATAQLRISFQVGGFWVCFYHQQTASLRQGSWC